MAAARRSSLITILPQVRPTAPRREIAGTDGRLDTAGFSPRLDAAQVGRGG